MKETEDCFLKVKSDYLNFLNKEKIFDQSKKAKIESLKKVYIPMSFWINNKYEKKRKPLFLGFKLLSTIKRSPSYIPASDIDLPWTLITNVAGAFLIRCTLRSISSSM